MNMRKLILFGIAILLVLGLTSVSFARGKGQNNFVKIQVDAKDWKVVEPALKNYYEALKELVTANLNAGFISEYYAKSTIDMLTQAYQKAVKTKTIYLPPFGFGPGMGFGPKGHMGFNQPQNPAGQPQQGPQQGSQGQQNPQGQQNLPPAGPGFVNPNLTEQQKAALKSVNPFIIKVIDSQINLYKSFKDVKIITDTQYSNIIERLNELKKVVEQNQLPLINHGIMQFLMLCGYNN
jgi:hypothetical protein